MSSIILIVTIFAACITLIVFLTRQYLNFSSKRLIDNDEKKEKFSTILVRKYPGVDPYRFRGLFFRLGLILSIGFVLAAFTLITYDGKGGDLPEQDPFEESTFEVLLSTSREKKEVPKEKKDPVVAEIILKENIFEPEVVETDPPEENNFEETATPEFKTEPDKVEEEAIRDIVEEMPSFPGCETISNLNEREACTNLALKKYLSKIEYPRLAVEYGIEGTVYVTFVIDKQGNVTMVKTARGTDKLLDEAAIKHIKTLPRFNPGKQQGTPVKVRYTVPVKFELH